MKKYFIYHAGRCASTSLWNLIHRDLGSEVVDIEYPSLFEDEPWQKLRNANCALAQEVHTEKFYQIAKKLDIENWNLIIITRNCADWMLAAMTMGRRRMTTELEQMKISHPGKTDIQPSYIVEKSVVMAYYWGYKAWVELVRDKADTLGWGKVHLVDFDDLINNWPSWGEKFGGWKWDSQDNLMMYGPQVTWKTIINVDEVCQWFKDVDYDLSIEIKNKSLN